MEYGDRNIIELDAKGAYFTKHVCAMQSEGLNKKADIAAELAYRDVRIAELESILNTPEFFDFIKAVPLEAAHQLNRWGSEHDAGKSALDWFWLIGYLAQKAATAQIAGDMNKALHHTISTAAALSNWHSQMLGNSDMRPGIMPSRNKKASNQKPS